MHTKRVIPCLDVKDGRVVKGVNFVNFRDAGDPSEVAAAYDAAGADEVVFLDITASADSRATPLEWVRIVTFLCSVSVHTGQQDFSRTERICFHCPLDCV